MGLGSGIRKKPIPNPGSTRHRIPGNRIRNTVCNILWLMVQVNPLDMLVAACEAVDASSSSSEPLHTPPPDLGTGGNHLLLTYLLRSVQCSGSMTFWGGSGTGSADPCLWLMDPDPSISDIDLQDASKKLIFNTIFSANYFYKGTFTSFSKDKKSKKSQNRRNQGFSYYFCMMIEGSGSGSIRLTSGSGSGRLKNMWIRWVRIRIRIRNTGSVVDALLVRSRHGGCSHVVGHLRLVDVLLLSVPRSMAFHRSVGYLSFVVTSCIMSGLFQAPFFEASSSMCGKTSVLDPDPDLDWIRTISFSMCGKPVLWIRNQIWIGSGFSVPGSGQIRSQEGRNDRKIWKKFINFIFWSAGCSLLRAEGRRLL